MIGGNDHQCEGLFITQLLQHSLNMCGAAFLGHTIYTCIPMGINKLYLNISKIHFIKRVQLNSVLCLFYGVFLEIKNNFSFKQTCLILLRFLFCCHQLSTLKAHSLCHDTVSVNAGYYKGLLFKMYILQYKYSTCA